MHLLYEEGGDIRVATVLSSSIFVWLPFYLPPALVRPGRGK